MSVSPSSINPDEVRSKEIWAHKDYVDTFLRIWKKRPEQKTDARGNKLPEKGMSSAKGRLIKGEVITTNKKNPKCLKNDRGQFLKHNGKYIVRDGRITSLTGYKNGTPYKKCSASVKAYISWVLINKWEIYYKSQVKKTINDKEKEQSDLIIKTTKLTSSLANHKKFYEKKLEEQAFEIKHLKENEIIYRKKLKELELKLKVNKPQENDFEKKYFDLLGKCGELKTENKKLLETEYELSEDICNLKKDNEQYKIRVKTLYAHAERNEILKEENKKLKESAHLGVKKELEKFKQIKALKTENEKYKKLYDADPDEMGCDKDRRLRNIDFYIEKLKKTYALCKIRNEENKRLEVQIKELVADDVNELKIEKLNKTIEKLKAKWVESQMEGL